MNSTKQQKPYGEWDSPITTDLIISQAIGLGSAALYKGDLYWTESRPQEGGRNVVVRRFANGEEKDVLPAGFNVRTRVHEYGGDAWLIHDDRVYFVNFVDQQVHSIPIDGGDTTQLTDAPDLRFANGCVDAIRQRIIYVIEDHSEQASEPSNKLGAVDLGTGEVTVITEGHDFYSSPTISPDGNTLVWLDWDHPNMPWDGTTLNQATIESDGSLGGVERLAGGPTISIQQPRYNDKGELHYISDESGWWNIYRFDRETHTNLMPKDAEFGGPAWGFGSSSYQFHGNAIICNYGELNISHLAVLIDGKLTDIDVPYIDIGGLSIDGDTLIFGAAGSTTFGEIVSLDLKTNTTQVIKTSSELDIDPGYVSLGEAIQFETAGGDTAHAFYYPPTNKDFEAPATEAPPLLVILHGGPTGATHRSLSLRTQYWTSRGFALLDVNYRGSTGYGRAYRDKLKNAWGVADVEDSVHGSNYLVAEGKADKARLAIRGGSAGGYTVLAALAFADTFTAGASHYGIADLEALARDTHKFESRYLDSLIGRYPEDIDIYKARSPINHVDKLTGATIFFQGLEDKIVPPNQAEMMVEALSKKGIPVAYVPFEGEQHGFRKAENIKRSMDLELYFYGQVFGFTPADKIEPIKIINHDA